MTEPIIKDITITQGDDVKIRYRLKASDTSIVDISGYDFQGQIRLLSDNTLVKQFIIDKTELSSYKVYYTLSSTDTTALDNAKDYVYDLIWKDSGSKYFHFKMGRLIVRKKYSSWV